MGYCRTGFDSDGLIAAGKNSGSTVYHKCGKSVFRKFSFNAQSQLFLPMQWSSKSINLNISQLNRILHVSKPLGNRTRPGFLKIKTRVLILRKHGSDG